ncbi:MULTISPECIES: acyl carrier protein [Streptomyces]|uniref:Acyl carrier protein n=1 Tax=Streptomyces glycanivorans TaxID=3033808 RepID=A0ABY9J917_9ACTN|nr:MULTISPECIES: acyl carrier protein [unclassified Streptomyces]WLQ63439.1 acyl carrier protein [Streptomyces sp. Alt3]WSR09785.1 acyl carrier protein [Streptomyces sp. NBC_01208]WSR47491.1 acyl carrier protein [Streptomyces sp. NBC_01201]
MSIGTEQNTAVGFTRDGSGIEMLLGYPLDQDNPLGFDPEHKLSDLGMDSIHALSLCGEVEERYGLEAESTLAWDHPTIEALTRYLAAELAAG